MAFHPYLPYQGIRDYEQFQFAIENAPADEVGQEQAAVFLGFLYSFVAGVGATSLGALLALLIPKNSSRWFSITMGGAGGVLIYTATSELLPASLEYFESAGASDAWAYNFAVMSLVGGVLLDWLLDVLTDFILSYSYPAGDKSAPKSFGSTAAPPSPIVRPVSSHVVNLVLGIETIELSPMDPHHSPTAAVALPASFPATLAIPLGRPRRAHRRDGPMDTLSLGSPSPSPPGYSPRYLRNLIELSHDLPNFPVLSDEHETTSEANRIRPRSRKSPSPSRQLPDSDPALESESTKTFTSCPKSELQMSERDGMQLGVFAAIALALHNFPEGLATFASTAVDPSFGAGVAVAVAAHNIPEGIAVALPVYCATNSRLKAFAAGALSGFAEPFGALIGFLSLNGSSSISVFGVLFGVVGGMLLHVAFMGMIRAALKVDPTGDRCMAYVVGGYVAMGMVLSLFAHI